jgi:hypothetical protein
MGSHPDFAGGDWEMDFDGDWTGLARFSSGLALRTSIVVEFENSAPFIIDEKTAPFSSVRGAFSSLIGNDRSGLFTLVGGAFGLTDAVCVG